MSISARTGVKRWFVFLAIALLGITCYPTEKRINVQKENLAEIRETETPTKIHLTDGSVILAENGFTVLKDAISCTAERYSFRRTVYPSRGWIVPMDSIAGLEYFDRSVDGARALGSLILGATITFDVAIAAVILLKAIFGSCPTVYSLDAAGERLEAECFSYSISRQFEMNDLDRLSVDPAYGGNLRLRLKNEALETHYVDRFRLAYVDHPAYVEVYPDDDGNVLAIGQPRAPFTAATSDGVDILSRIAARDDISYTSGLAAVRRMLAENQKDRIECTIVRPPQAQDVVVVLRVRNTLQNTVLLYDVMMRDQGIYVLEWLDRISNNVLEAYSLYRWYKNFAGMEVALVNRGRIEHREKIFDTGPIAWKDVAVHLPLDDDADTVTIRFEFLPDNWAIDYVGFSFDSPTHSPLRYASLEEAKDQSGAPLGERRRLVDEDDDEYLVTYPGESIDFGFVLPPLSDARRTLFVDSKGFYIEWVRPEWIKQRPDVVQFDPADVPLHRKRLAELWVEKKDRFERQFFDARIPTTKREEP
jgi:hypothetical protein